MARTVSEPARERETFKYDPHLLTNVRYNDSAKPLPSSELVTSQDVILTALAQLGTCQLNTARSLVSLFDQQYQYIVAEATPTLPLIPGLTHDDLWLCGTAIPRRHGACEYTLLEADPSTLKDGDDPSELPLALVPDLTTDVRFSSRPYCLPGGSGKFYAAVPIRTHRGINIGVYCVVHTEPRNEWDARCTEVMRNISRSIMDYLESRRSRDAHRRNERMSRGIGSFVEGKATMSGWRFGPSIASFEDNPQLEGALNRNQQSIQREEEDLAQRATVSGGSAARQASSSKIAPSGRESGLLRESYLSAISHGANLDEISGSPRSGRITESGHDTVNGIFSKAANIIRESIEVEGVLFLDANIGSFGGLNTQMDPDNKSGTPTQSSTSRSNDESKKGPHSDASETSCEVIGFSTSDSSSIDGSKCPAHHAAVPEKLLSTLLRRYPQGKIFSFDKNGELQSSDSSGDDRKPMSTTSARTSFVGTGNGPECEAVCRRPQRNPWARSHEGSAILEAFPGARSVAFVPVWNSKRERWFAGGFVYTYTPTRTFTLEGELSYLRAFGTLAMAATFNLESVLADKAKFDILSSLSHELRSPLHGIVLSAELLSETKLDVLQENILHTLETCGRTLLDTIDHLLDFSKINNFATTTKNTEHATRPRGLRNKKNPSIQAGMKTLSSNVRLDVVVEEIMESVFAGFNFHHISIAQLAKQGSKTRADIHATRRLDEMKAMEELGPSRTETGELRVNFGNISIYFDVDPACSWTFYTQLGAIRRIVMNLFGNSLKYTHQGAIKVSLMQGTSTSKRHGKQRVVKLIIADTGRGIGKDYLRNDLFKAFSQEDNLAPGAGLGLSLVKQIVSQLNGSITVDSCVGMGTTVSVSLPLTLALPSSGAGRVIPVEDDREFEGRVSELRGLRIRLLGFDRCKTHRESQGSMDPPFDGYALMENICHAWLHMEVISDSQAQHLVPDVILCTEEVLEELSTENLMVVGPPTVVICRNALVAYKRSNSLQFVERPGIVEFVSQPIGPRKLAKILSLAYKQWADLQVLPFRAGLSRSQLIPTPSTLPTSTSTSESKPTTATLGEPDGEITLQTSDTTKPPTRPASEAPDLTSFSQPLFLLVDDNHINLMILSSYMKKLGRTYATATDGQQAVDIYCQSPGKYKCIFMDISMPVMDGFEATRRIRTFERKQKLKPAAIFALTGLASAPAQQEAFGSGIELFLTKPVRLKELRFWDRGICYDWL